MTETLCMWIDSQVSPWTFGAIEACSVSELVLPVGAMTVMAFDVSPSKRSGALVAAQIIDGKIGVGVMEVVYPPGLISQESGVRIPHPLQKGC